MALCSQGVSAVADTAKPTHTHHCPQAQAHLGNTPVILQRASASPSASAFSCSVSANSLTSAGPCSPALGGKLPGLWGGPGTQLRDGHVGKRVLLPGAHFSELHFTGHLGRGSMTWATEHVRHRKRAAWEERCPCLIATSLVSSPSWEGSSSTDSPPTVCSLVPGQALTDQQTTLGHLSLRSLTDRPPSAGTFRKELRRSLSSWAPTLLPLPGHRLCPL